MKNKPKVKNLSKLPTKVLRRLRRDTKNIRRARRLTKEKVMTIIKDLTMEMTAIQKLMRNQLKSQPRSLERSTKLWKRRSPYWPLSMLTRSRWTKKNRN